MNFPSESSVGGEHAATKTSGHRLIVQDRAFNSASEALEAYITEFEKRTHLYTRRPSDLLAPKPKFYFMDSLERSLRGSPTKSPGQRVDELVQWVNYTYDRDLSSRVQPFGFKTTPELPGSLTSDNGDINVRPRIHQSSSSPHYSREDEELFYLPSPNSSVVDLDSNAGTVETEILLSSYKGERPIETYSRSPVYPPKKGPSPGSQRTRRSPIHTDGSVEYPSWVSGLGKEYPSWVEDLDITSMSKKSDRSPKHQYISPTSSSSDARQNSSGSSTTNRPGLKVSDLRAITPAKQRTRPTPKLNWEKGRKDWADTDSIDTDMLVSQSVYGLKPVNMGGELHHTLYEDKKVARLKKEATTKLRKTSEKSRSRIRERTPVSPRSKSLTLTPARNVGSPREYQSVPPKPSRRSETRVSPSTYKDYSPLRSGDLRTSPSRERLELRPGRYSMSPDSPKFSNTEEPGKEDAISPSSGSRYVSPSTLVRQRLSSKSFSDEEFSPSHVKQTVTRKKKYSPSHTRQVTHVERHSPSHTKHYVPRSKRQKDLQVKIKEESDVDSTDTDREMRKSPTGIRMEKMYRDPSTMYPWKSMMQSHSYKSVYFSDDQEYGKPVYESTPAVRGKGAGEIRNTTNKVTYHDRDHSKRKGPTRDPYGMPHRETVTPPEKYVTQRVTHHVQRPTVNLKAAPVPVITSVGKSASLHRKPPIAPRSSQRVGHRRSNTMPNLRNVPTGTKSLPHPGTTRRSYDDDMLSIVTSDTELLVTQPSMPLVDVSPSLTTVSDSSDTLVGSDTEREVSRRPQSKDASMKEGATLRTTIKGEEEETFSPTSVFASSSPYAAVREDLPKRYHLWKLDEDTTAPDSFIRKKHLSNDKSTIISSFLEDCLNIDEGHEDQTRKLVPTTSCPPAARLSGREGAPGPVEALKNMLFTMQDMAHHEDGSPHNRVAHQYRAPRTPDLRVTDLESVTDDQSDYSSDIFRGQESLQRAYHHLERLKRLVGSEDDRSSVSSGI